MPEFEKTRYNSMNICVFFLTMLLCSHFAVAAQDSIVVEGNARFTVIAPECIRIEYTENGRFVDAPSYFAVNRDAGYTNYDVSREGGTLVIDTGRIRLEYTPDGGRLDEKNLSARIRVGDGFAEWKPGMKNEGNLGGTIRTVDGVSGPVDLGEGYLSRDGWYLYDDSQGHLLVDGWVESRPGPLGIDWYLFGYGHDYKAGLRAMTAIAGKVPLPRKYMLGAWYSRYWPYSSDDYRNIVREYHEHDFPLDVMVLDMDWHRDGWTGWSWNRELLPDAEELLAWFHEKGLHTTLNVHPADGVGPHEDMYADFMKDLGEDPSTKKWLPYDAGDKQYLDTLFKHTHVPKEKAGVDFWWLDWQQYKFTRSIPDLTNLQWLNHYYFNHTKSGGRRGASFSRWGGPGDHRHPIHFSGDAHTIWPMLAFEVPFTSTAGNVGCFFWSHDIGGHMGPRIPESYTRWVQFGATTAALRSHSTRSPEQDRRPWKYPEWAEDSMRISFHLRSVLFPYIYSSARQSNFDSIPLNRPMYIEYPGLEKSYRSPQQYFFGDAFLVAPVVSPGEGPGRVGVQTVWFPEGVWYNWFTGERFDGEADVLVAADINEFPLYARGGVPVPMQPFTERMSQGPGKRVVVRCYPGLEGETGSFAMYEDDGESDDYMEGAYAETKFSCLRKNGETTVSSGGAEGSFEGQGKTREYVIELPCTQEATEATVDGSPAEVDYSRSERINRILVAERPVGEGFMVKVAVKEADNGELSRRAALDRVRGVLGGDVTGSAAGIIGEYAAKNPGGEDLDTLLAAGGVGTVRKNEGLYYYQGAERTYLYARPGILDGDSMKVTVEQRLGSRENVLRKEEIEVAGPVTVDFEGLPEIERADVFGPVSRQVVKAGFSVGGSPIVLEETVAELPNWLGKWNVIGPFEYDRSKTIDEWVHEPEEREVDLKTAYSGLGGQPVKWRRAAAGDGGIVDLTEHFFFEQRIAYAATYIYSKTEQTAALNVWSDDGIELWMNGQKFLSSGDWTGFQSEPHRVEASLKPGGNVLLAKVSQLWNDWGFRISIETPDPVRDSYTER